MSIYLLLEDKTGNKEYTVVKSTEDLSEAERFVQNNISNTFGRTYLYLSNQFRKPSKIETPNGISVTLKLVEQ